MYDGSKGQHERVSGNTINKGEKTKCGNHKMEVLQYLLVALVFENEPVYSTIGHSAVEMFFQKERTLFNAQERKISLILVRHSSARKVLL